MKLSIAIDQYVARKRTDGYAFRNEEYRLAMFCRSSGDLDISDLSSDHVVAYLDRSEVAIVTWRLKYFLLLRFFEFLHRRKAISAYFNAAVETSYSTNICSIHLYATGNYPFVGCDVIVSTRAELHDPSRDVSCSSLDALHHRGAAWGSCRIGNKRSQL
jgi:hypothetical protein